MKFFAVLLFFTAFSFLSAKNYTISGFITDEKNGETLINASVIDSYSLKGMVSNSYGFYSLTLPVGDVKLRYSYVGYEPFIIDLNLSKDTTINVSLKEQNVLDEITVLGHQNETDVQGSQMSAVVVPVNQIKSIPTLLGEADVIKALQLLPGVQSGTEGSAGMYVRGGGPDENLVLLDGVPIYNVNHMLGFFSVFNADAIKNATLYKGSFPARFGGRLSSVIDLRTNDGDDKNYHGSINVGLVSAKINVEGPIIKEKTTFNISARRTYIDLIAQPFLKIFNESNSDNNANLWFYFYDLNVKLSHKFSDNDRLYFTFYTGDDAISAKVATKIVHDYDSREQKDFTNVGWKRGNIIASARWNHIITNKMFMNTTASVTKYRYNVDISNVAELKDWNEVKAVANINADYKSKIQDYGLKVDFDYLPNPNHDMKFGVNYTYHNFCPGIVATKIEMPIETGYWNDSVVNITVGDNNIYTHETALYIEDNITFNNFIKANIGLHYSAYSVQKQFYHSLQPRLGTRFILNKNLSAKIGYAYMSQYVHLLSSSSVMLPTDLWVPVTKNIVPMKSHQISAGFFYSIKNIADFSVETYYKTMDNLIEYKDGVSFMGTSTGWEQKINVGRGWAYGIELLAQRSFGKTTGWIGYTWSKSERLFKRSGQEINFGKVFPAKFDRRHDISLTFSHKFNEKIDISGNWIFSTGQCGTLELYEYPGISIPEDVPGWESTSYNTSLQHVEERNNYRYDSYHRLDLGINFHKQKKRGKRTWNISIYNVYSRLNPFLVYPRTTEYYDQSDYRYHIKKSFIQLSLFPIIPSVSYSFRF